MELKSKLVANQRLLVANRGEIAIRLFRAGTELNMRTVAIYSHEDRFAMHRFKADEAYKSGQLGDPLGAYLNWQRIIELAKQHQIEVIHPGYGFLSENPEFAQACADANILFCGPPPKVLETFGDKLKAKAAAIKAGIPIIPGSIDPVETLDEAKELAKKIGYPITLKALSGGGGKGIRIVQNEAELLQAYELARSEAKTSFGKSEVYIEKTIVHPKHIEVQILADCEGNVVHLYERDCSIQRRHQKVVELAPALGIAPNTRNRVLQDSVNLARSVNYIGVGTIEFLVDQEGASYFLEVNPRIQVEHTVTEMVTGIDIAQASIMLPAGRKLSHPAIGINSQDDIKCRGVAIQCRITTEDPQRDFAPDIGQIIAYRPAQGFGVRLDEGLATSGGTVTPHYDSLLTKVTTHGRDLFGAANKMIRALSEFRIRGVRHNIPLLLNIVSHEDFYKSSCHTGFFNDHPELFKFKAPQDRASKVLRYIGEVTINNPHDLASKVREGQDDAPYLQPLANPRWDGVKDNAKGVFDRDGVKGLQKWIKEQKQVLLTDTTMRDAHQSLFATRLRNRDIFQAADFYRENGFGFFSLEVWGGATFDTCMRFLKEDPWERLARIRNSVPNNLLQMLLRGDNAVGYTNYPEWVIRDFIRLTKQTGLDLFRIFDCLNNAAQMRVAIEEVKKQGGIAEVCICYTGNILDPNRTKYDLNYYIKTAKEFAAMGADILCIKDMAGLLRPKAAVKLITELKQAVDLPLHLHTHATSGNGEAMLLAAAEAGCDIIDGAVDAMSGLTSQPSLNALVASLEGSPLAPKVPLHVLDYLSRYWQGIRSMYQAFDPGIKATTTQVYAHEIPGGQYSNLVEQARRVGVSAAEFHELTERYREVNELFGDIIKVTPSSKVVGDMALFLQKHKLTGEQYRNSTRSLDYPDSVVSFFKGHMGLPLGGFPTDIREKVLGANPPAPEKPPVDKQDSYASVKAELQQITGQEAHERDVLSYRIYPKVYLDFFKHNREFGSIENLPTSVFFYGLEINREIEVDLERGKTLYISVQGISEPNDRGFRTIFFKLNGFPREIEILDQSLAKAKQNRPKADTTNLKHVPAPMPGKVVSIAVAPGDQVVPGQKIMVTESMKMEYAITAKQAAKVKEISVKPGDFIEEGDLLVQMT